MIKILPNLTDERQNFQFILVLIQHHPYPHCLLLSNHNLVSWFRKFAAVVTTDFVSLALTASPRSHDDRYWPQKTVGNCHREGCICTSIHHFEVFASQFSTDPIYSAKIWVVCLSFRVKWNYSSGTHSGGPLISLLLWHRPICTARHRLLRLLTDVMLVLVRINTILFYICIIKILHCFFIPFFTWMEMCRKDVAFCQLSSYNKRIIVHFVLL